MQWPGFGTLTASAIAHPEPVMAHRYFPQLRRAVVRASYTTDSFGRMLAMLGELGFDSEHPLRGVAGGVSPEEFIGHFLTSATFHESRVWHEVVEAEERLGAVERGSSGREGPSRWRGRRARIPFRRGTAMAGDIHRRRHCRLPGGDRSATTPWGACTGRVRCSATGGGMSERRTRDRGDQRPRYAGACFIRC